MATVLSGSTDGIYLLKDTKGRTYIKGLNETRQKFLAMGGDRNLFEKWIKEASIVVAREATKTAPSVTGKLATSVRGFASKSVKVRGSAGATGNKRMMFGGVVTAGSPARVPYARAVSLGTYHVAGQRSVAGDRVWRTTVRGRGNPYIVKAREKKKSYMVTLLNFRLNTYIKQKGFETK